MCLGNGTEGWIPFIHGQVTNAGAETCGILPRLPALESLGSETRTHRKKHCPNRKARSWLSGGPGRANERSALPQDMYASYVHRLECYLYLHFGPVGLVWTLLYIASV